ncbi:MAG: carbonic anhydrase [Alphaproteobacteria bacterium]|nr:carbonic anhydrase [Alphaproteobacteria bacterium]
MSKIDDRLVKGYQHFRDSVFESDRSLYEELATMGQKPHTLLIACSDSRVLPQQILSAGPGDLFVVRNVAAMVPPYEKDSGYHGTSAAIEFAVTVLEVDNIVVMGHAGCGGVASVIDHSMPADSFVHNWMRPLREWLRANEGFDEADPCESKRMLERAAVHLSLQNLKSFPFVKERVEAGDLSVVGFIFDIHNGDLSQVKAKQHISLDVESLG